MKKYQRYKKTGSEERKSTYPQDWMSIRHRIICNADKRCQCCGASDAERGYRLRDGSFITVEQYDSSPSAFSTVKGPFMIRLNVVHEDGNHFNNDSENVRVLCDGCKLRKPVQQKLFVD